MTEHLHPSDSGEDVPPERDFSIIWTTMPLSLALRERLDQEQARIIEEGEVSHSKARADAKKIIERELTDIEYESILAEISSRPPRNLVMPRMEMRPPVEEDEYPVSSVESDK